MFKLWVWDNGDYCWIDDYDQVVPADENAHLIKSKYEFDRFWENLLNKENE